MNKYIIGGIGLAFAFGLGFGVGKDFEYQKRQKMIIKIQEASISQLLQQQDFSATIEKIGDGYYEDYKNATASKPNSAPERLFIKADCHTDPMPQNQAGELGNGAFRGRAELQRGTLESLAKLADKWESDLLKCEAQRNSLLSKIKAYNASR